MRETGPEANAYSREVRADAEGRAAYGGRAQDGTSSSPGSQGSFLGEALFALSLRKMLRVSQGGGGWRGVPQRSACAREAGGLGKAS